MTLKRLSNYDRLMVLALTPEFRNGLLELTGCFYLDENAAFAAHWELDAALLEEYRELCERADGLRTEREFVDFADMVNTMPLFPGAHGANPTRVIRQQRNLMEIRRETRYDIDGFPEGIDATYAVPSPDHSDARHLRDNRFLTVELDLFATKEQVIAAVGKRVDHYHQVIEKKKSRQRELTIDPWAAYRWHVTDGKQLHEIASSLIESAPKLFTGEDPMAAAQQAVHRAVQKAREMLQAITLP